MDDGYQPYPSASDDEAMEAVETDSEEATVTKCTLQAEEAGERRSPEPAQRSIETQTELDDLEYDELGPGPFPLRRAVSDWAVVDSGARSGHIRSERIRRTAQMFDQLASAEEARRAAEEGFRSRRPPRAAGTASASTQPLTEREVHLVLLPAPPADKNRSVDAILALGSQPTLDGRHQAASDDEGDETDEEQLWEKVRAKISARRDKFLRMESGQLSPKPSRIGGDAPSPKRLSTTRTGWLTNGKQREPPPAEKTGLSSTRKMSPPAEQTSPPDKEQATTLAAKGASDAKCRETTKSWSGKYIEQNEEQTVLRSLGSAVLAKQKLAAKQKTRDRLVNEKSEAERRKLKAENQRTEAQSKLLKLKGKLTRDSVFERKGMEEHLSRLENTIRDETRNIDKITKQIDQTDASLEELVRRAAT